MQPRGLHRIRASAPAYYQLRRDNAAVPRSAAGGAVADSPVQTSRKQSNFQLLNCESTSDRFQSASQKTTYITLKSGHARRKSGIIIRAATATENAFFFSFRPRSGESSTLPCRARMTRALGFCPPLWWGPRKSSPLWQVRGEKQKGREKKISAAISHFKNRYFLGYSDYVTLKKDTNALANVISGYVRASFCATLWIKV